MLLRMPELDLKLADRNDVPIGIGVGQEDKPGLQSDWLGDYQLADYIRASSMKTAFRPSSKRRLTRTLLG